MIEEREQDRPFPAPPRPLVWLSLAVLIATVVMAFAGAWRTGIGWDETYHVERMENYLDHGWYALDRDFAVDGPAGPNKKTFVYAPVTSIVLHGWSVLLGAESPGEIADSYDAYRVRHLGVVLIGLVGLAAAAAISRRLLGRGWGLVTAALLGALPLWTGMIMVNIKDVPVATGCTVLTLGLVLLAGARRSDRLRSRVARIAVLALGGTLAVGTRPGMWTLVVACVTAYVVLTLLARRRLPAGDPDRPSLTGFAETALGLLVTGGLLLAAYPNAFGSPVRALRRSAEGSADFAIGLDSSRSYLFERVALTIPVLMTCLWIIGFVVAVGWLVRSVLGSLPPQRGTTVALVGVQAFTLPVLAILLDSVLYNGLRQMLFVTPACAVLATIGLAWAVTRLRERAPDRAPSPRVRTRILAVVAAGALVVPVVDQALLFPFNYAYANLPADLGRTDSRTDYWRTSVNELAEQIPNDGQVGCSPFFLRDGSVTRYTSHGTIDCRIGSTGPLAATWREERLPTPYTLPNTDFYVVLEGGDPTPPGCERVGAVTRWRHGRTIVMSLVARCSLPAPVLPPGGAKLDDPTPRTWRFAVRGWEAGVLYGGLRSGGTSAAIAFRAPAECAERDCSLTLAAVVPEDLTITASAARDVPGVGETELSWERTTPRRIRTTIPAEVVAAAGAEGLWLTFARAGGGDLGMSLRLLRLSSD